MVKFATFLAAAALALPTTASAESVPVGRYRLDEGHEAAGALEIAPAGRFQYFLSVGALDERAKGRWERMGNSVCLFTEPQPKGPEFSKSPTMPLEGGETPTLLVTWPNGRGIAGVDFRVGFDRGDPIEAYTQEYGWTLPEDEPRSPRWFELSEPIHRLTSPRFALDEADGGKLHVVLTPNDLGVVDFVGACLEQEADHFVLHRREGSMRFVPIRD